LKIIDVIIEQSKTNYLIIAIYDLNYNRDLIESMKQYLFAYNGSNLTP